MNAPIGSAVPKSGGNVRNRSCSTEYSTYYLHARAGRNSYLLRYRQTDRTLSACHIPKLTFDLHAKADQTNNIMHRTIKILYPLKPRVLALAPLASWAAHPLLSILLMTTTSANCQLSQVLFSLFGTLLGNGAQVPFIVQNEGCALTHSLPKA